MNSVYKTKYKVGDTVIHGTRLAYSAYGQIVNINAYDFLEQLPATVRRVEYSLEETSPCLLLAQE
ncbi:hypothetical protein TI10_22330 [Photorhabdus luminescens subsp. luminescens]|uniref:Uncharacterized protein n=1 Tax=Photorhabdus luminescens TaxID=29488 RepID=A0A1G5QI40_PHOLU|nr:hypothetical protein [Photorhabdus luminescens]KMW71136.1 hypothetical protein TI10_22330 [Photorhabdus luminescens subsp. luminescens]SCZ61200.1 hypothetical protein SAMN02982990_01675 [Photorhabdus luminescens]